MSQHREPATVVGETPCPRCGCYLTRHFECGCGEVHDDYCVNCGRWVSLAPTEHVELSIDAACTAGRVPHVHSAAEKRASIDAYFKSIHNEKRN